MTVNLGKGVEFSSKSKQNKIEDWTLDLEIHGPICQDLSIKDHNPHERQPHTTLQWLVQCVLA